MDVALQQQQQQQEQLDKNGCSNRKSSSSSGTTATTASRREEVPFSDISSTPETAETPAVFPVMDDVFFTNEYNDDDDDEEFEDAMSYLFGTTTTTTTTDDVEATAMSSPPTQPQGGAVIGTFDPSSQETRSDDCGGGRGGRCCQTPPRPCDGSDRCFDDDAVLAVASASSCSNNNKRKVLDEEQGGAAVAALSTAAAAASASSVVVVPSPTVVRDHDVVVDYRGERGTLGTTLWKEVRKPHAGRLLDSSKIDDLKKELCAAYENATGKPAPSVPVFWAERLSNKPERVEPGCAVGHWDQLPKKSYGVATVQTIRKNIQGLRKGKMVKKTTTTEKALAVLGISPNRRRRQSPPPPPSSSLNSNPFRGMDLKEAIDRAVVLCDEWVEQQTTGGAGERRNSSNSDDFDFVRQTRSMIAEDTKKILIHLKRVPWTGDFSADERRVSFQAEEADSFFRPFMRQRARYLKRLVEQLKHARNDDMADVIHGLIADMDHRLPEEMRDAAAAGGSGGTGSAGAPAARDSTTAPSTRKRSRPWTKARRDDDLEGTNSSDAVVPVPVSYFSEEGEEKRTTTAAATRASRTAVVVPPTAPPCQQQHGSGEEEEEQHGISIYRADMAGAAAATTAETTDGSSSDNSRQIPVVVHDSCSREETAAAENERTEDPRATSVGGPPGTDAVLDPPPPREEGRERACYGDLVPIGVPHDGQDSTRCCGEEKTRRRRGGRCFGCCSPCDCDDRRWRLMMMVLCMLSVVVIVVVGVTVPLALRKNNNDGGAAPAAESLSGVGAANTTSSRYYNSTLAEISARGVLRCGISDQEGHGTVNVVSGQWEGFSVDLCRAVAAAVFGEDGRVEYTVVQPTEFFTALGSSRQVDMLASSTTHTMERDIHEPTTGVGYSFSVPYLYDGLGFGGLVPYIDCADSLNVTSDDCQGMSVCVVDGSTHLEAVKRLLPDAGIILTPNLQAYYGNLRDGICNVIAGEGADISESVVRDKVVVPGRYRVSHKRFSREPLSLVTREDDAQWSDFVNWVFQALMMAEEVGIDRETSKLLGNTSLFGRQYEDMFSRAVSTVGTYGDMYRRHLEPIVPRPDANQVNRDGASGLIFSMPFGKLQHHREGGSGRGPIQGGTLQSIRERGYLRCGIQRRAIFAMTDSEDETDDTNSGQVAAWSGLDIDLCRAVSAAIFEGESGSSTIRYRLLSASERFRALSRGEVDLLSRFTTLTYPRDVKEESSRVGFSFSQPYFYDGLSMIGIPPYGQCADSVDVVSTKCQDLKICVAEGTTFLERLEELFPDRYIVRKKSGTLAVEGLARGDCNAMCGGVADVSHTNVRVIGKYNGTLQTGTRRFTKDPLALVTRQDDRQWSDFVYWVVSAIFFAEEKGIARSSAFERMPAVNLLGPRYADMFKYAVSVAGNYGELFSRYVEPEAPRVGLNTLDPFGPKLYAYPGIGSK